MLHKQKQTKHTFTLNPGGEHYLRNLEKYTANFAHTKNYKKRCFAILPEVVKPRPLAEGGDEKGEGEGRRLGPGGREADCLIIYLITLHCSESLSCKGSLQ